MLRVYNYMAAGVALTGLVAYVIFTYSVTTDPALAATAGGRGVCPASGHVPHPVRPGDLRVAPQVGGHARAARVRVLPVLAHLQDEPRRGAAVLLAVRGGDGRVAVLDLPGLHRQLDHAGVLRDGGGLRRAQPLRLHDQEGPLGLGLLPDHGRDRHHRRRPGQPVPAVGRAAVRHLRDRRAGVRGPHRLRHPADQGQLLRR